MVAIDLSKQQAIDAHPKATQEINFTQNLDQEEGAAMSFIIEEAKETVLDFSQGTVKVLLMCSTILFCSIWYQYKMTQYRTLNLQLSNS